MKSLTTILLLTTVLGIAYSAGGACKYVASVTNAATEWNYKQGGAEWSCGACKTNKNQQSPIDVKLAAKGTAGVKTDLTVKVDVPDSKQACKLLKSPSTIKVDFTDSSTK